MMIVDTIQHITALGFPRVCAGFQTQIPLISRHLLLPPHPLLLPSIISTFELHQTVHILNVCEKTYKICQSLLKISTALHSKTEESRLGDAKQNFVNYDLQSPV